jgi:hypothetical protein
VPCPYGCIGAGASIPRPRRAHGLGYFLPPAVAGSRTRVLEAQTLKEA